jgi:hypothetical protein
MDTKKLAALIVLPCVILATINRAVAAPVTTSPSTVMPQQTYFYGTYDNGDVIFRLTTNTQPQCVGYWLRAGDAGLKNELAALMVSISAQLSLIVNADDAVIWAGSSSHFCLVTSLSL